VHALPPPRDPHEGRPGRRRRLHGGHVRGRRPGHERGPRGPAVRRPRRRPARDPARPYRLVPRRRLHHQHRQVPPARQPRSRTGRDRGLRAVSRTTAPGARPVRGRDAGPLLDGTVHARRADLPGPRNHAHRRSRNGRPRCHGVRDVSPGGRAPHTRHRAGELRGRGADPDGPHRGPSPAGRASPHRRRGRGPAASPNIPAAEPASSPTPPETDPAADQLSLF
jgi:hypothetical protein